MGLVYRKEPFVGFWKLDVEKSGCTMHPKLTAEAQFIEPSEAGLRAHVHRATKSNILDFHLDNVPRDGRMPGRNPSGFNRIASRRVSNTTIKTAYFIADKPVGKSTTDSIAGRSHHDSAS